MTELNIRESAWAELHDPRTGQDRLAQIAGAHPEFASAIAAHPNAYPALQEWAAGVQPAQSPLAAAQLPIADPAVGAPAAEHRDNSRTWLVALVLFAAVELVRLVFLLIAFRIIQQSPGNGSAGDELLRWTGVLADAAQLVIVGVGVLLSARSAGRRIGAALLAFLIPCFTVAVQLSMGSWTDVFLYGALLFSRIPELWILFYLALALSYAVARPVRGAGWAGVTLMALAYPLAGMAYFIDDWSLGQVVNTTVSLLLFAGGAVLAEALSRAAERREAAHPARTAAHAAYANSAAGSSPSHTNGMAVASLVCAFFISILAVIFGHIAHAQIRRTGEDGRGLATAGLVLGYLGMVGGIIGMIAYALWIGRLYSAFSGY